MKDFFDRAEVFGVLQGFNPWWTGAPFEARKFHRLAYQACLGYLKDRNLKRAILLSGPRRVGKTTILNQIADDLMNDKVDPKSILYLSLDHPLLKLLSLPQILRIYHDNVISEGKPGFLLLDEVQYSTDWELQLKQLIDHKPEYRILATGSASVIQHNKLAESGVGRWIKVTIPTLSFYEFVHIRNDEPPKISPDLRPTDLFSMKPGELADIGARFRPLMPLFNRYLLVGGFPETARQQDIGLCQRLLREDVVERVLKRDMTMLFGIRNISDLEKLFIYLCLHTGGIIAVQSCAKALRTTATTVCSHLESLEQANLIYRLSPDEIGGKKVLKARHKVYLVDAALRNAVLLRGEEILRNSQETGIIVETAVLRHLYAYHYRETPRITYWRDSATDKEVDMIVKTPNYAIPVEVKYRDDASLSAKDGIVIYCRETGTPNAYWVTQREQDFGVVQFPGLDTRFMKVPAHIFTYLLGQAERLIWAGKA